MRTVIFNAHWLGDVLFSTPAIRAIKKHNPYSFIACIVPERCAPVLRNNPHIDEVIVFPDKVPFLGFWNYWVLAYRLKVRAFDTAIFFQRSSTKTFVARLAGIRRRIGYGRKGKLRSLTSGVPSLETTRHRTDHFLGLLEPLGVSPDGREPDFIPSVESEAGWERIKRVHNLEAGRYIVIHAGGNWDLKRWPSGHFVKLIGFFLAKTSQKIVLCGTQGEKSLISAIASSFTPDRVVSLAGETSLDELALLLKDAALLVSNDSGPIHLGASQKVSILGLYGPTRPELTGPITRGLSKILHTDTGCELPCYYRSCNGRVCLEWLSPEEVFREATALLAR